MTALILAILLAASFAAAPQAETAPPAGPVKGPAGEPAATPTAPAPPEERIFALTMVHAFTTIPKSLQEIDLWVPIPPDDAAQKVFNRYTYSPYDVELHQDEVTGNLYLYMKGGPRGGVPMKVSVTLDVQRFEVRQDDPAPAAPGAGGEDPAAPWLPAAEDLDPGMTLRASRIVEGKTTPRDKARAIYDWVIDSLDLLDRPEMYPWAGQGRVETVLREKKGSSVDFAAVYVALCRAAGIPARPVIGYRIPKELRQGQITRRDGWAEVHIRESGWIPVDPAAGKAAASRRAESFGRLDPWRVVLARGRGITLVPPQSGPAVDLLQGPYWEGNRETMPPPGSTVEFRILDAVPPPPSLDMIPTAPATSGR